MIRSYICNCSEEYSSGGFCPHCNSRRIENINEKTITEILEQKIINSEIPLINNLAQYIYAPQYVRFLEYLKRMLPTGYAKQIDDSIEYVKKQNQLIDIEQNFGGFLEKKEIRNNLIELHKKLTAEFKKANKYESELAYIDSLKTIAQINAIENFFNQAQYTEKVEALKK